MLYKGNKKKKNHKEPLGKHINKIVLMEDPVVVCQQKNGAMKQFGGSGNGQMRTNL